MPDPHFEPAVSFGPYRLLPRQRLLCTGESRIRIGGRALDLLIALTERPGEMIPKRELMARVWPDTTVEEANLKVHIGALRDLLGGRSDNHYIETVIGRGYCFTAPVAAATGRASVERAPAPAGGLHNLPQASTALIGRAAEIAWLCDPVQRRRFITLTGPGGVGKTRVALAAAEALLPHYRDGTWLADLAFVGDWDDLLRAVAGTLRIDCNTLADVIAGLRSRQMLLLLDTCDRVVEPVVRLVEAILREAPGVDVLVVSRETMRSDGEAVCRIQPLPLPPRGAGVTPAAMLAVPAAQLFVERAMAHGFSCQLGEAEAPLVAEICHRLDGLPLALELAALQAGALGLRGLIASLSEGPDLLALGRRATVSRQRSLRATIDWSYDGLSDVERRVLQRLAMPAGPFTAPAAQALACDAQLDDTAVRQALAGLVAKSLLLTDTAALTVRYRLLDTTRVYARDRRGLDALAAQPSFYHALHNGERSPGYVGSRATS